MDTRRRRFFAAVAVCQSKPDIIITDSDKPDLSGWHFQTAIHPRTGNKMVLAERPSALYGEQDPFNTNIRHEASLYLTATRLDDSTETSAGISLSVRGTATDMRHSIMDGQGHTGLVYCKETAPAYIDTAQIPIAMKFDNSAKPDVAVLRGIPRILHVSETTIFLEEEMSKKWASGEPDNPSHESAISGRISALEAGDTIAFGIPYIHPDHEIVVETDVRNLDHAVAKIKALVAP